MGRPHGGSGGYLHEVWREVSKVAWPSQKDVAHDSTLVLVVILLLVAAALCLEAGLVKAMVSVFS